MLKRNNTTLPEEALYRIRFHSFYPFHGSQGYLNLCSKKDLEMLPKLQEFRYKTFNYMLVHSFHRKINSLHTNNDYYILTQNYQLFLPALSICILKEKRFQISKIWLTITNHWLISTSLVSWIGKLAFDEYYRSAD